MSDKDERDTSAGRGTPGADESAGPPNPRQHSERGINPVQHSERGINPVQHSERGEQPSKDKDKPKGDDA
jgi:hypothetical protein